MRTFRICKITTPAGLQIELHSRPEVSSNPVTFEGVFTYVFYRISLYGPIELSEGGGREGVMPQLHHVIAHPKCSLLPAERASE